MNIFYLDSDPQRAATYMVDKHIVKMILESAQLLSTAHRYLDGRLEIVKSKTGRNQKVWTLDDSRYILYKATHVNHPSNVWIRESVENYNWLVEHLYALIDEYDYRYAKKQNFAVIRQMMHLLQPPPFNLKNYHGTPAACAMPDEYKISDDPVQNYRQYYRIGKADLHKWTKRQPPEWIHA